MGKNKNILVYLAILAAALVFPMVVEDVYVLHTAILSGIYVLLTMGLNLLVGYTGQLSLAHASFFGIGAYTSAILTVTHGWGFWPAILASAVLAAICGIFLGLPALKLKGPYLVMSTIGFVHITHELFLNWISVTRGPMGITGIAFPPNLHIGGFIADFSIPQYYFYLILFWIVIAFIFVYSLIHSKMGRAMKAIRENDIAAECLGINLKSYKLFVFSAGAMFAGIAGSLYVHYIGYVSPDSFTLAESINILVMVILGGMGTLLGPIVGAVGVTFLLENMRFLAEHRLTIYGLILMLIMFFAPWGLMGYIVRFARAGGAKPLEVAEGDD